MSGGAVPGPGRIFRDIDDAEKRLARAERDLDDLRIERAIVEGQATDSGRMTATPHGKWLVDDVSGRFDKAFAAWRRAGAELNALLAELDTWRMNYRDPRL